MRVRIVRMAAYFRVHRWHGLEMPVQLEVGEWIEFAGEMSMNQNQRLVTGYVTTS